MKWRDLARDHGAFLHLAGANSDVVAVGDHVADCIVEVQLDFDVRIEAAERRQQRQNVGSPERRNRSHAQPSGRGPPLVLDGGLGALELSQRANATLVEQATFLGEAELSGGALEQPHAEPALETLHVLAHGNG